MAIVVETFYVGERQFNRVYSDANRYVVRDGISYSEACDPTEFGRTYTEGDIMEDGESSPVDPQISDKAEAYDILIGDIEE